MTSPSSPPPIPGPHVGDAAPAFSAPADSGATLTLVEVSGSPVVLYFYPRDDTSGCTKEALEFTALAGEFAALGAVVVGASKDSPESHDAFIAKHDLGVRLISDLDGSLCEAYGVWVEKSMYGRKYMGIERSTFLIDGDGRVAALWRKARPSGHAAKVLKAVKELTQTSAP